MILSRVLITLFCEVVGIGSLLTALFVVLKQREIKSP